MDRLAQDLDLARQELTPDWTPERSARLYAGALQVGRRRTVRRIGQLSLTAVAAAALLALGLRTGGPLAQGSAAGRNGASMLATRGDQTVGTRADQTSDKDRSVHTLRLADGSRAELVGEHSELEVTHNTADRIGLRLVAGRAHFEVVHDPMRSFVVEAHPYRVEVIGTIFDVERSESEVGVSVRRGKVRVYGPRGAEDLVAGQIKRFALNEPTEATAAAAPTAPPVADEAQGSDDEAGDEPSEDQKERVPAHARPRSVKRAATGASWRSLSQSGQYEAAFESLRKSSAVEDDPAALMDAADAARLSGHAQDAVQYLARVVSDHRRSPVAPLAAFTLGRVYLDKLGQPERAAESFGLARALAPNGSMAQDALAREVEALSKGGNAQKAYVRAREYLGLYPNGRRLRAVQLYGGLE
jgi:transmembrane sensor